MQEFQHILEASSALAEDLSGHVFIGGVAIYLHAVNSPSARQVAEFSHDSDLMISLLDYSILRDHVEVVANPRLGKHQVILEGVEFDVYVERQNKLVVPYDEIYAHAKTYGNMHVACPEHLLVLKLEAHLDRFGSAKGDKDARDLVSLALASRKINVRLLSPYLRPEHVEAMRRVGQGRIFEEMCLGNAHEAKRLRVSFNDVVKQVARSQARGL